MEDTGRRPGGSPPAPEPDGDASLYPGQRRPGGPFSPVTPGRPRTPDGGAVSYPPAGYYPAAGPLTPGGMTPRPPLFLEDAGFEPGTMLGKYQIVCRLGSGGMGSVYEAIHTGIAKPVAVKTLSTRLASEPRSQTRFLREAAAASRLNHPHVVDVTDYGAEGGVTFIVMELLRGEDLAAMLAREPAGMPLDLTADIMLAVCAGVFAAHEAGVIHRDLKPQNIFLAHTAVGDVVPKVLDFGISKLLDEQMSQTLTGTGMVMGTTPYLSPEQVAGHPVDGRSDQYTLGVILYESVTGRRPHDGDSLFAIMRSIADGHFVRPRQLRPDIPPAFEAVILRAMGFPPDRRYESVHALGQALLPFGSAKGRVVWADYFGSERGAENTAPLPAGNSPRPEPLFPRPGRPDRADAYTPGGRVLPSTHTGGRRRGAFTPSPRSGYDPVDLRPSRWPAVLMLAAILGLAGGGWWAYRTRAFGWPPARVDESVDPPAPGEPALPPVIFPAPPRSTTPILPDRVTAPVPDDDVHTRPGRVPENPPADDPIWPERAGVPPSGSNAEGVDRQNDGTVRPSGGLSPRPTPHRPPKRRLSRPRPEPRGDPEAPIID
jgi:serine/threonine protein kinase